MEQLYLRLLVYCQRHGIVIPLTPRFVGNDRFIVSEDYSGDVEYLRWEMPIDRPTRQQLEAITDRELSEVTNLHRRAKEVHSRSLPQLSNHDVQTLRNVLKVGVYVYYNIDTGTLETLEITD